MSWDNAGSGGGGGWDGEATSKSFDEPAGDNFGYGGENQGAGGYDGGEDGQPGGNNRGGCYNCGEDGHNKAECTNPAVAREFTGECRLCGEIGHRASDCPTAPPKICYNCKEEEHTALECTNPRKIDRSHIEDVSAEHAWAELTAASLIADLDDMKEATWKYIKATPDATYVGLEKAFRNLGLNLYIIALEKELQPTFTNMNLQGILGKKYTVTWRKSPNHSRPKEKELWPETPEANLERLLDAGDVVDRGIPKCSNCDEVGHMAKSCTQDKNENERTVVQCFNCDEVGHRVRDCPQTRPDKFACRNCKQSGHGSKDCPEPRSAEGVECKKCGEVGHFARDCPQGGGGGGACHNCGEEGHRSKECTNERKLICRNCDAEGHVSKECPKPRDYSRVKCMNCQQMGHTKVRCTAPMVDEDGAEDGGLDAGQGAYGGESGGNDFGTADNSIGAGGGEDKWGVSGGAKDCW